MDIETAQLRQMEALIDAGTRELDRLSMRLLAWPHNIVVIGALPAGTWAYLPDDWQTQKQFQVNPLISLPPWKGKGVIGVSIATARQMIKLLEQGYRGR